ncbi:SLIT3 [Mytilus edulis]|uniref:SLIT3 n=1 Tax=Mytilus edulis TaxID=6550 RepID=A0A8S3UMB6_MYTED|nr:SLIT3 [Mytilus edulis]
MDGSMKNSFLYYVLILLINHDAYKMEEINKFWSPDSIKELWCPNKCFTQDFNDGERDECCACHSFPQWQKTDTFSNISYISLDIEIDDVQGKHSNLVTQKTLPQGYIYFGVNHQNGLLKQMPKNICDFRMVSVDFTGNRFFEIGNISCLQKLDTLILKRNKIHFVSNATFVGLKNLRVVDLSENVITLIENNVFGGIHVFDIDFGSNSLRKLDVTNIFIPNKVFCDNKYSTQNNDHIEITNEGDFQLSNSATMMCGSVFMNNSTLSGYPVLLITKHIEMNEIGRYLPCGQYWFQGSSYDCDCHFGHLLDSSLDVIKRIYKKGNNENICSSPEPLLNMGIEEVWVNESLRNMMTCDVIDNCTKTRSCHCQCTIQSSQKRIIVDCSNQSCTRFPDVVPDFRYNYDLVLNLSRNNITTMDFKDYFRRMSVLDLNFNPISVLEDNFNQMGNLKEMTIQDHSLKHLPKTIQLLDPNIFRFGKNGIPCHCDNLWISEWRIYKNASDNWKLYCSNYVNKTFEDIFYVIKDCGEENTFSHYFIIYTVMGVAVLISLPLILSYFRYELMILHRRIKGVRKNAQKEWKYDTYISFDVQNEYIRKFVILELIPFLESTHKYRMYVPCRDSIGGDLEEDSIINNMKISKTVLMVHSKSMYGFEKSKLKSISNKGGDLEAIEQKNRRVEYSYAWSYFTSGYLKDMMIIDFDHDNQNIFNKLQTKALHRLGMTFDICNRTRDVKTYILKFLDRPIKLPTVTNVW